MIAFPDLGVMQRWNLKTLQREKTAQLTATDPVDKVLMGSNSAGALLVWTTGQPVLWDCEAMKPIAVEGPLIGNDANFRQHVRVSADGRVFISGTDRMSGQHFHVMEKATTASSIATGRTLPASIRSMPCWRATRRGPRGCGSPTARRLALPSASWARPTGGSSRA